MQKHVNKLQSRITKATVKGDNVSFDFHLGRSAKDACEQIFDILAKKYSQKWILEGDIKGCSNNINHNGLMENIPLNKILRNNS